MLGIIGGMGPQAGISLYQQILAHTLAHRDQDHVPAVLWSTPDRIPDRTAYLLGQEALNPAYPVADIVLSLEQLGVTTVGIPCNTFHSPLIWDEFMYCLGQRQSAVNVVHLIKETVHEIKNDAVLATAPIGVLGTLGTYKSRIYSDLLKSAGVEVIEPCMKDQIRLHDAIYNTHYGIKSLNYIGKQAGSILIEVSERFQVANLLLGCTELCLDWQGSDGLADRFRLVNPLAIVAKAMVMGVNCSTVLA